MIEWLGALPSWLVVLVLGVSIVVESGFLLGLVLPGTTAVIATGVMIGLGVVPAPVAYPVAVIAAITGPSLGWWTGRRGGPTLRTSALGRRIPQTTWTAAEGVIASRGRWAVAVAQFVVGARTLVPLLAGMAPGSYTRFALVSVPSAALWSASLTGAGHLAGASYQALTATLGNGTVAIAVIAVVVLALGTAGRFLATRPQWGLLPANDRRHRLHATVDRIVTRVVGQRRAPLATGVLWWLVAVLGGLASSAAVIWAVRRSDLAALDDPVTRWVAAHSPYAAVRAAEGLAFLIDPSTVLLGSYLLTALFIVRHRGAGDRLRRTRAITTSLGLAALAVASDSVASWVRDKTPEAASSTRFFDLQIAVVPCALALAVVLLTPWVSRPVKVLAWTGAAVLTALVLASRLVLTTMTLSEVIAALTVGAAWTVLLVGLIRPATDRERPRDRPTRVRHDHSGPARSA